MPEWASEWYLTLGWERITNRKSKRFYRVQRLPLGWELRFSEEGRPYFENTLQQYCTRRDPRTTNLPKNWAKLWTDRGTPLFLNLITKEEVKEIENEVSEHQPALSIRRATTDGPSSSGIIRFSTTVDFSEVYEEFEHQPLASATSIRLLKYVGKENNSIPHFLVEDFDIEKAPPYVALSYTWGDPKPFSKEPNEAFNVRYKWPILCNGTLSFITKNLHDYLQQANSVYHIPKDVLAGGIPLHYAAYRGQDDGVNNGIDIGMPINSFDILKRTPLYLAAEAGHESTVRQLLSHGADTNLSDTMGRTPLFIATVYGREQIVRLLLLGGADPELKTSKQAPAAKYTALHFAIRKSDIDVAKALLDAGASTETRLSTGVTALHHAACCKNAELVRLLLLHGAQIEAEAYDEDGLSSGAAIIAAAQCKSLECVSILVENGAFVNARNCYGRTALHQVAEDDSPESLLVALFLLQSGAHADIKSLNRGWTALHSASAYGKPELLEAILDAGVNIEEEDQHGRTALHIACEFAKLENIGCLLKRGASINAQRRLDGKTSLHMSVGRASQAAVTLLLSKGADVNSKDYEMKTPLHQAVGAFMAVDKEQLEDEEYKNQQEAHRVAVAIILLNDDAEVDARDNSGYTALHHAAGNRKSDMVSLLLSKGANPNAKTPKGSTPLMWAASYNDVNVVKVLLNQGADLMAQSETDWPLLSAVQESNFEVAEMLIKLGVDLMMVDKDGDTALHIAALCGKSQMISLLLKHEVPLQIPNLRGWVPLDYAVDRGHVDCARILIDRGAKLTRAELKENLNELLSPKPINEADENGSLVDETPSADNKTRKQKHEVTLHTYEGVNSTQQSSPFDKQQSILEKDSLTNGADEQSQTLTIPYIWIDALCINQANDTERTGQIKIMSQIYQKAAIVHVWLGLEDKTTKLSSQTIQKLVKYHTNKNEHNYDPDIAIWYHTRKRGVVPKEVHVPINDELTTIPTAGHQWVINSEELDSFQSLVHRQWFERIWIAQELSRARYVHMSCGRQTIPWEDFYRALMILMPARAYFAKGPQIWKRISEGTAAFVCAELHARFHPGDDYALSTMATITPWSHSSRLSLSALLLLTWNFKASEPRDKIFALLGLVTKQEEEQQIRADYARSVEDLYIEVTITLLNGFGEIDDSTDFIVSVTKDDIPSLDPLEALTFAGHGKYLSKDGLPSWVPDFGNPACGPRLWYPKYEPYGEIPRIWSFPEHGLLRIRGAFCESIAAIEIMHKNQPAESIHRFPVWLNLMTMDDYPEIKWDEDIYGPVVRLRHALTFVRRTDTAGTFSADLTHKAFTAFLRFCIQKRLLLEARNEARVNWLDWRTRLKKLYAIDPKAIPSLDEIEKQLEVDDFRHKVEAMSLDDIYDEVRPLVDPLTHFTARYRLFRADDGYVGLVPKEALPLDRLCVMGGASTVFVLRKIEGEENRWRLIGEAFMQDVIVRSEEQDIDLE